MKICCLLPSAAEILYALDLADHIIGVSDLCQYPPEILKTKPIVSRSKIDPNTLTSQQVEAALTDLLQRGESPYQLDQQWLTDAAPDLIFTQDLCHICEIDANEVTQTLQQTPIQPQIIVLQPRTYQDILDTITQIGQICAVPQRAHDLVTSLTQRANRITQTIAAANPRRPKVLSLEGINPLVAGGHWIPDLLQMAGGHLTSLKPGANAQRLTWQEIQTAAPEKLYIDLCSSDLPRHLREIPWLAAQPGWPQIPAVANGEVYLIDHTYLSSPAPRATTGLEILAQLTHPNLFQNQIPPNTVAKLTPSTTPTTPENIAARFHPYP